MANEDPAGIPEQVRQNRPVFIVFGLLIVIAVCTFLFVLFLRPGPMDVSRNPPPAPVATTPAPAAEGGAAEGAAVEGAAPAGQATAPQE